MEKIGEYISTALKNMDNQPVLSGIRTEVKKLAGEFPIYSNMNA